MRTPFTSVKLRHAKIETGIIPVEMLLCHIMVFCKVVIQYAWDSIK
jgi:hypothetical protein